MNHRLIRLAVSLLLGFLPCFAYASDAPFQVWVKELKIQARGQGISDEVLNKAFEGIRPSEEVLDLDQSQPETTITFEKYMRNVVSRSRIENGRDNYEGDEKLLKTIANQYGVPAKYIVALWGVETAYGRNIGDRSIIESLATLAYDGRRSSFFRGELLAALRMMEEDHIEPDDFVGSWAGAMGQCQFMPTSFLKYAVDYDKDGKRDIWNNKKDVFASIANYLSSFGWNSDYDWGYAVNLPVDASHKGWAKEGAQKNWSEWLAHGVTLAGRKTKLNGGLKLTLIYPDDDQEYPFLVTSNFDVIMKWNRSQYFAVSVGTLADAIE